MDVSQITLVGRLTRDPELVFMPSMQAIVKMSVAVERKWKDKSGEEVKKSSFFDVVQYGKPAENIAQSLTKGSLVVIVGRLEQRSWETPDGSKRYAVEVVADEVAASLRFVTVEIHAPQRDEAKGSSGAGTAGLDFDEEPF